MKNGLTFYGSSALNAFSRQDVLDGIVIKINPALITIVDNLVDRVAPEVLQQRVRSQVVHLLQHKVNTFHLDINFEDYSGFAVKRPTINTSVFTPDFLSDLNDLVCANNGYLNLHLMTDHPNKQLSRFEDIALGAVCFQLDAISDPTHLDETVQHIASLGACASPVVETVGSKSLVPNSPERVFELLKPAMDNIGMLTFQAAGTGSRTNPSTISFAGDKVSAYLALIKPEFKGTVQIQGGITTETVGEAIRLGAEFLVCGTQLFYNKAGYSAPQVIDLMLEQAAQSLDLQLMGR